MKKIILNILIFLWFALLICGAGLFIFGICKHEKTAQKSNENSSLIRVAGRSNFSVYTVEIENKQYIIVSSYYGVAICPKQ